MLPDEKFSVTIPATLEKSEDGQEWRVYGLASTSKRDQQGEIMDLKGLDLTPIEKGRGVFNIDHKRGFENTVGIIDSFKKTDEGLYLGGYLFKNHDRAKAVHQIMSSLKKSDRGRMGMSVEGVIQQRAGKDGKVIKKAIITSCALTMNPVNSDTYVNLVKSLSGGVEIDGTALSDDFLPQAESPAAGPVSFTADQVVCLLQKALGVGSAYASNPPTELSGGDALAAEDLDEEHDEKAKAKKKVEEKAPEVSAEASAIRKSLVDLIEQLQALYPDASRTELWESVKDRLARKFGPLDSE